MDPQLSTPGRENGEPEFHGGEGDLEFSNYNPVVDAQVQMEITSPQWPFELFGVSRQLI